MNSDVNAEGYRKIQRLEELAKRYGFSIGFSRHCPEHLALLVADTAESDYPIPVYARNVEFMTGTVDDLVHFLRGWHKRYEYEQILRVDKIIEKREDKIRQERTLELLKQRSSTERTK
jgi:hypothetical protein